MEGWALPAGLGHLTPVFKFGADNTMWIPDPLYEWLPAIYAGTGIGSVAVLGVKSPAPVSAFLLMGAATAIMVMRRRYRLARKAQKIARDRSRREEAKSLNLL
jgi:hypothetical protein